MSYQARPTVDVLIDIKQERARQDVKWGQQNHPDGTGGLALIVLSDAAREACDRAMAAGETTWRHILLEEIFEAMAEDDSVALRKELVQSAAVIVNWIEDIDTRRG